MNVYILSILVEITVSDIIEMNTILFLLFVLDCLLMLTIYYRNEYYIIFK